MTVKFHYEGLYRVISGAQTGADQAGLYVAREFGLETGGCIARTFRTSLGPMPYLAEFGVIEHSSFDYPPRTKQNARDGDMTVRLATNFNSAGEKLTLKYIHALKKPHFDVLLDGKDYDDKAEQLALIMIERGVSVLNVAGNADRDTHFGYHFNEASKVLTLTFEWLKTEGFLKQR